MSEASRPDEPVASPSHAPSSPLGPAPYDTRTARSPTQHVVLLTILVAFAAWYFPAFARWALSATLNLDDWEWLLRGGDPGKLVRDQLSFRWEVFRPIPQYIYALDHKLFGVAALPLAALFLGVHVAAAVQAARLWRALGMSLFGATLAALIAFYAPENAETFLFLSLNQVVLSRLFMLSAMLALARREQAAFLGWFPWTAAALLTHEQSILMAPLLLVCFAWRDGLVPAARRLVRDNSVTAFVFLCVGYAALRVVLNDPSGQGTHALGLGAIPQKLDVFYRHYRSFFVERFLYSPSVVFLAVALPFYGVCAAHWLWCRRLAVPRVIAFGALFTLVGYAPYFLAVHETAGYHFALALTGLAVPLAAYIEHCLSSAMPLVPRLAFAPLAVTLVFPVHRTIYPESRPTSAARILDATRAVLASAPAPPSGELTHLVLLDPDFRADGRPPQYLAEMSGEFDYNHVGPPDDGRNAALQLTFPGRRFRVYVLAPERLPFLCARPDDVVLRVHASRDGESQPTYQFSPLPACSRPGEPRLPPALEAARVEGQEAPGMAPLLVAARAYWRAYAAGDRGSAISAGDETIRLARVLKGGPAATTVGALIDGVSATIPAHDAPPGEP